MRSFDDGLATDRKFDNFQFVDLHAIEAASHAKDEAIDAEFALAALMELPAQYAFARKHYLPDRGQVLQQEPVLVRAVNGNLGREFSSVINISGSSGFVAEVSQMGPLPLSPQLGIV
jgi:hypothetical protein